jgi:molybdenum-dependent DNA-binding transcriptional regulator ModE
MNVDIKKLINSMHWFEIELLKAYYNHNKNISKLSKDCKISYMYLWRKLNKLKQTGKFKLLDYPEYFNQN